MKKLCCERDVPTCERMKALLETNGIVCVVKTPDEASLFAAHDPATGPASPEIWVVNDADFDRA